jgi:hypothetical protein
MFIRTVTVKGHKYYRLVESYRQGGKVKQRYIATICSEETWGANEPEVFADQVADYIRDMTDAAPETGNKRTDRQALMEMAGGLVRGAKRAGGHIASYQD